MFADLVLAAEQAHTGSAIMSQSDLKSCEFCQNHFCDCHSTQISEKNSR